VLELICFPFELVTMERNAPKLKLLLKFMTMIQRYLFLKYKLLTNFFNIFLQNLKAQVTVFSQQ